MAVNATRVGWQRRMAVFLCHRASLTRHTSAGPAPAPARASEFQSQLSLWAPMPDLGGVGLLAVGGRVIYVPPHLSFMENH